MSTIKAAGGEDREEAIEIGLWHANLSDEIYPLEIMKWLKISLPKLF